jgi:ABC-type Fe3+/spermidine/putrescine transport system ATPase subunit
LLRHEGLTRRFGPVTAVRDLTAAIRRGEPVSFVGPNGCGQTTLLRLIGGFLRPDAGRVVLDAEDITGLPPNQRATAMVFQNYALFPHLIVAENVGYALAIRKRPKELLLDELLSNLDANLRLQMRAEITRLPRERRLTVVFATHDLEEAMSISDRIMVMHQGRILQVGTPADIYERPAAEFVARFVGAANFLAGTLSNGTPGGATVATPLGTLKIRAHVPRVKSGKQVCLVVWPESIRLHPRPDGTGPNRVTGRIETATYTGALLRYTVDVSGTRLTVDLYDPRHAPAFRPGDAVTQALPDDPHILPQSGEA